MRELLSDPTGPRPKYRGMDRAAIDLAYDNAAAFSDVADWRERWRDRTSRLRLPKGAVLDIPYGSQPLQKIDLFPLGHTQAPTALFFHGGFWSRNGKETFRFLLEPIHQAGFNAAFAGYTLAPDADFGDIVRDAGWATQWLASHLADFGLADEALVLIGWSAGAHLLALQMDQPGIAAGLGISGIYDLEPMRIGSMNDVLRLDEIAVQTHSPIRWRPRRAAPLTVAYGTLELPEFQRQSVDFHDAWSRLSLPVSLLPVPGHHHSVLEELYCPVGVLSAELTKLRQLTCG
jgi:arylformamidase